jgi:hypothetical protein
MIWLVTISAYAATPDQLYQTWEKNAQQPAIAEKAAQDYLHVAPQGPHAHDLKIWLDAYHKALASLTGPQPTASSAPAKKQAVAQPTHPPQPDVQIAQPAAMPPKSAAPSAKPAAPPTRQASAIPKETVGDKKQQSEPRTGSASVKLASLSLEETLAFIADKVANQDRINFTAQFHNPADNSDLVEHLSYRASDASIDPNRCQLSFHWHVEEDGKRTTDEGRTVRLYLAKNIRVETIDQTLADLNAAAGHPFSVRVHPEVYAVHITQKGNPSGDNLYFRDRVTAEQIGEATKHALEFCGDGASKVSRHR